MHGMYHKIHDQDNTFDIPRKRLSDNFYEKVD